METIEDSYFLSPMQQGMLFHSLYAPQSGVDIEQIICTFREDLNVSVFKQAWQQVVERQPVLRTSFRWEEVKEPLQEVYQHVNLPWEEQDWRNMTAKQQEKQLETYLQAERRRGFVLTQAPLMRLALFHLAEANYQFIWTFHHALLDGRSFPLVLQELFAFYEALSQGQELQLEQSRPYRDYIDWLGEQSVIKAESFWRRTLNGFTTPTPLALNDVDQTKSNQEGYEKQGIRLSETLTSALQSLAQQNQLTLNTLLQGAWALLLSRYSGEEDVIFGATRAGRRSALKGAESIVGLLINTLPVRAGVSPEKLLLPWLRELRAQWLAIRDYEHTPLVKVQGWSEIPPGKPLFESILIFENYQLNSTLRSLGGNWQKREFRLLEQTNYPLTVAGYAEPELLLEITYERQRFNNTTIARMLGHIRTLLESMVANLNQPLSELPILTQAEHHQLLVEWNDTQVDYPRDVCIHQLFEAQVEKTPDAVAVVFDNEQLTYQELNCRANQLAHYLQKMGVGPEVLVGICVERSLDLGAVILGTLKAGGACVLLDPTEPDESLAFFLEDAQLSILLTQERLLNEKPFLKEIPKHKPRTVCVDQIRHLVQESSQTPPSRVTAENLAYITYTSGSTGKPKGVMTSHRALCSRQLSWQSTFQLTEADRLLLNVYRSLILHYLLIGPLLLGGRVIMARPDGHRDSAYLAKLIAQEKITGICVVPSLLRVLLQEESFATCSSLRKVFCGSEALPVDLQEHFFASLSADLYNIYGLTETTFATIWKCQRINHQEFVPIGRPTANTKAYILDTYLQPVPVGVSGELYIGGDGLARGYLNRPELTAERFMPNPFDQPGSRLYKTGDLACYQADGSIKYLGRLDRQVKIRGFRIELAEIEAVLKQHPAVQQTAILAREDIPGDKRLVAYVVPMDQVPTFNQLRSFLAEKLPSYMVPSHFTFLETIPRMSGGKLDYNALPLPSRARPEIEETFVAPRNPVETVLADIWVKVLNVEQVGLYDNFFVLGGNSLLGVQIVSSVRKVFHVQLPLKSLFETPTLIEMSQAIITHQAKPGLAEKIALVIQRVKNMPVKEMREMLQKKKGNR